MLYSYTIAYKSREIVIHEFTSVSYDPWHHFEDFLT